MTRKRSKYRPKPNLKDPLNYVLSGISRLPKDIDTTVRTMNHISMELLRTGKAKDDDIGTLSAFLKIALALARPPLSIGTDWVPELLKAQESLRAIARRRPNYVLTGPELTSLNLALQIHDAQLDKATVIDVEMALKLIKENE